MGYFVKIYIRNNAKNKWLEIRNGGVANLSYPTSKTKRGRVIEKGDISPTITATDMLICVVAMEDE